MCGIIVVSKNQVVDRLVDGLERLEYRGYDSAGVAAINNSEIGIVKSMGKLNNLKKLKVSTKDSQVLVILDGQHTGSLWKSTRILMQQRM